MTLKQWETYYTNRLTQTREHIAKRGGDDGGHEYEFFEQCVDKLAVEIVLSNGARIVKGSHCRFTLDEAGHTRVGDDDWVYICPDGHIVMNAMDGKTPYHFGRVDNVFYCDEANMGMSVLTGQIDEDIPAEAQEHYIP